MVYRHVAAHFEHWFRPNTSVVQPLAETMMMMRRYKCLSDGKKA